MGTFIHQKEDNLSILPSNNISSLAVALGCKTTEPIHITDQLPMLELMQQNIQLNSLTSRVQASIYDWGESVPSNLPHQPDILLAADCVYFEPAFPLLLQTMNDLIGTNTVCYFCFKKRRRADLHFVKAVKKNFNVEPVDDDEARAIYSRENLFLYVAHCRRGGGQERLLTLIQIQNHTQAVSIAVADPGLFALVEFAPPR